MILSTEGTLNSSSSCAVWQIQPGSRLDLTPASSECCSACWQPVEHGFPTWILVALMTYNDISKTKPIRGLAVGPRLHVHVSEVVMSVQCGGDHRDSTAAQLMNNRLRTLHTTYRSSALSAGHHWSVLLIWGSLWVSAHKLILLSCSGLFSLCLCCDDPLTSCSTPH